MNACTRGHGGEQETMQRTLSSVSTPQKLKFKDEEVAVRVDYQNTMLSRLVRDSDNARPEKRSDHDAEV
jgi:hypothetical protein